MATIWSSIQESAKENEQFELICDDVTLKYGGHENILGVTVDNKLSFDEQINNIYKPGNKKFNTLSKINHYMEQNQKELLLSPFIIFHLSYCHLIWMFCSKKSTKKINALYKRSLRIILNDYKSPYSLLLEEAHKVKCDQRCINSFMIEVYMYHNGHYEGHFQVRVEYVQSQKLLHLPDRKPSFIEVHLSIYLFTYLSIYLSIYLYV